MKIIKATENELDLIAPLFDEYRRHYNRESDIKGAYEFLKDVIIRKHSLVFLALDQGGGQSHAVGFAQVYPSYSSINMAKHWLVNDLYIKPEHRKSGITDLILKRVSVEASRAKSKIWRVRDKEIE